MADVAQVTVQPPDYFTLAVGIGVGLLSLYAFYVNYLSPPDIGMSYIHPSIEQYRYDIVQ